MDDLYLEVMEEMVVERIEQYIKDGMDENAAELRAEKEIYDNDQAWEQIHDRVTGMISSQIDFAYDSYKDSLM
jgi:hypothetical protein